MFGKASELPITFPGGGCGWVDGNSDDGGGGDSVSGSVTGDVGGGDRVTGKCGCSRLAHCYLAMHIRKTTDLAKPTKQRVPGCSGYGSDGTRFHFSSGIFP